MSAATPGAGPSPEEPGGLRVLLVYANPHRDIVAAPYGLEILASHLPAEAEVCIVAPFTESWDPFAYLRRIVAQFRPRLVGFNLRNLDDSIVLASHEVRGEEVDTRWYLPDVRRAVDVVRAAAPGALAVVGGTGFSAAPEGVLAHLGLDWGVAGPGEAAFARLAVLLQAGATPEDLARSAAAGELPGAVWRTATGVRRAPVYHRLEAEPAALPRRHEGFQALYGRAMSQYAVRSRFGCTLHCIYCVEAANARQASIRPVANVIAEVEALVRRHGQVEFFFADPEFNVPDEAAARAVAEALIDAGLAPRIRWQAFFNITPFGEDFARLLAQAGCAKALFCVDHFDDRMLRALAKTFRAADVEASLANAQAAGLATTGFMLLGGPGETEHTLDVAAAGITRWADRGTTFMCSTGMRVYPHTPLAKLVLRRGRANLYGADDPTFVAPVVYCEPCAPRELLAGVRARLGERPAVTLLDNTFPGSDRYHHALAMGAVYERAGRLPRAQTAYRRALDAKPRDVAALHALAKVAFARGDFALGEASLLEVADVLAMRGQAAIAADMYAQVARQARRRGDAPRAEAAAERCAALAPDHPRLQWPGQSQAPDEAPDSGGSVS